MSATRSLLNKSLRLLVVGCLMVSVGCAFGKKKLIVLPESQVGISHPTKQGYECFSTGYIQQILDEIEMCLSD